jgi:hypothetical protein
MKNLFSNILNKKQKEIIEEEKEELNVNEIIETPKEEIKKEIRKLPTGQATIYGILNMVKSKIKSNAIKPMIGKNNIILDDDVIELNFESKTTYNYEISWKEYFKRQIYVQNKSNYENLIQNLFENKIKQIEYSPQNDFYAQNGRFSSYFFHFTDFESALSILIDGYIYPHHKGDEYSSKKKFVHLHRGYKFNLSETGTDVDLMRDVYNYDINECNYNPRVEKLHFAFGFKKKDLKKKRIMYENHNYRYNKRINLKNKEFILLIRNYTF